MRIAIACAIALLRSGASVHSQGNRRAVARILEIRRPAPRIQMQSRAPRGRSTNNPSDSGSSTSGGRDALPETAKQPTPHKRDCRNSISELTGFRPAIPGFPFISRRKTSIFRNALGPGNVGNFAR